MTNARKYWISVASRDHALNGVKGGFAQFNHGKRASAARLSQGDGLIIYAPKMKFGEDEPCQKFVALGEVADKAAYQVTQMKGFEPWRRNIDYQSDIAEVEIRPLLPNLDFVEDPKRWGFKFRMGLFEIGHQDFEYISGKMLSI